MNFNIYRTFFRRLLFCFYVFIISFLPLKNCSNIDDEKLDEWEVTKRISPLIEAKANECNSRPIAPLFFTREAGKNEVEACERDMLIVRCPFKAYPWSCVRIF